MLRHQTLRQTLNTLVFDSVLTVSGLGDQLCRSLCRLQMAVAIGLIPCCSHAAQLPAHRRAPWSCNTLLHSRSRTVRHTQVPRAQTGVLRALLLSWPVQKLLCAACSVSFLHATVSACSLAKLLLLQLKHLPGPQTQRRS